MKGEEGWVCCLDTRSGEKPPHSHGSRIGCAARSVDGVSGSLAAETGTALVRNTYDMSASNRHHM
jgi:hypothetical protein